MGNILKYCCHSNVEGESKIEDNDDTETIKTQGYFVPTKVSEKQCTDVPGIIPENSVSLSSSSSSASDMRGLLTKQEEEEECVADTTESTLQTDAIDQTNKDESNSVVVELDKCSVEFDESSDKDSEEVSEPITQIEVTGQQDDNLNDET